MLSLCPVEVGVCVLREAMMSLTFDSVSTALDKSRTSFVNIGPALENVVRIRPVVRPSRTFNGNDIQVQLYTLGALDTTEIEFSLRAHLIILLPDGISGGCDWSSCDKEGRLPVVAPNTALFTPANEFLFFRKRKSQAPCRMLLIAIKPTIMRRLDHDEDGLMNVRFSQQIGIDDQIVCQTLVAIQQELESPGVNSRFYVDTLLMLLLSRLVRCASNLAVLPAQSRYAKGGLAGWRLRKALELLESNSGTQPSLSEIAQSIGLHPTSFCRAFKQSTGLSPHRYLLVHRVNRAKELMKDRNLSLTQIALDCGFSSSSQFSAVFSRIAGFPPRTYRRSM
jgi:AraC-like DNA-binding protein